MMPYRAHKVKNHQHSNGIWRHAFQPYLPGRLHTL